MRRADALIALAAVAALLRAMPARAFRLESSTPEGTAYTSYPYFSPRFWHWDLRELPGCAVPYSTCGAGTADVAGTAEFDAIVGAVSTWTAVKPQLLSFVRRPFAGSACRYGLDGWNVIYWDTSSAGFDSTGFDAGEPPDTDGDITVGFAAVTIVWLLGNTSERIREVDVVLNNTPHRNFVWVSRNDGAAVHWSMYYGVRLPPPSTPFEVDVRTAVTHELGHFVGLDHQPHSGTIMDVDSIVSGGVARQHLTDDDQDGMNFLYDTDLGDAPDPCALAAGLYPSKVHGGAGRALNGVDLDAVAPGAEHLFGIRPRQPDRNYTYEWLGPREGPASSGECEAKVVDRDALDDGVQFIPNPPVCGRLTKVLATVSFARDHQGDCHAYFNDIVGCGTHLWLSAWADENQDCVWADAERFIHEKLTPVVPAGADATGSLPVFGILSIPGSLEQPDAPVWVRARLDYDEDAGGCRNVDGTLDRTTGAAQFGEVEDYPISCPNPWRRLWVMNTTPVARPGLALAFPGDVLGGTGFAARGATPCRLNVLPPGSEHATYDPARDETVVELSDPSGIPIAVGEGFDAGRCQPAGTPPGTVLRAWWLPAAGGQPEALPTTHCALLPGAWSATALVGVVDDSTGGWIGGAPEAWRDSVQVDVAYRIAPQVVPLDHLDPCDPMVASLPRIVAGGGVLVPGQPLRFALEPLDTTGNVLLEVTSRWSRNASQTVELQEFIHPVHALVDVSPARTGVLRIVAYPDPTRAGARVSFVLPHPTQARVIVLSADGRHIRTLAHGVLPPGPHTVEWDGSAASGEPVPPGVYVCRVDAPGASGSVKLVRLR